MNTTEKDTVHSVHSEELVAAELCGKVPMKRVTLNTAILRKGIGSKFYVSDNWVSNGVWIIRRSLVKNTIEELEELYRKVRRRGIEITLMRDAAMEQVLQLNRELVLFVNTGKEKVYKLESDKTELMEVAFRNRRVEIPVNCWYVKFFKLTALFGSKPGDALVNAINKEDADFAVMPMRKEES